MTPSDCIFCKIAAKEIPSETLYENDSVVAFHDINPQAPRHILVIPRAHVESLDEIGSISPDIVNAIQALDKKLALTERGGYRLVLNRGPMAGQEVKHLHFHILSGRRLTWPPG